MPIANKTIGLLALLILLILGYSSTFVVVEGQQAIVLRLGTIVTNSKGEPKVYKAGLHFKVPLINQVRKFDVRLQTLSIQSSRILTKEQKYVLVDAYAKWRIKNLPLFFQRTDAYPKRADMLLQQQINDALRAEFGKRTIRDMVSGARVDTMALLKKAANKSAHGLGIEVVDVRIKRIDLPAEVSTSVFERMRAQREQVAAEHRAGGKAAGETIRARADATVTIMISQARRKAAKTLAEGNAAAAQIYSDAYGKAPDFYGFYQSLQVYKQAFNGRRDILLLDAQNPFFKYLQNPLNESKGLMQ